MINIQTALQNILNAVYGEEVRISIHDAIYIMSQICDIKVQGGVPTTAGYEEGAVYIDTDTSNLYKLESGAWVLKGNLEGNAIKDISKTSTAGLTDTYTITFTKADPIDFNVNNGNGVSEITKTSTSGLVDTYTISYTDDTSDTFDVNNGNGISSIVKTSTSGNVDTYTVTYTDGNTTDFEVTNGIDGVNGTDGIGVTSIVETSHVGREHIITVTLSDGNESTFSVFDGQAGTGTGDMLKSVYDTDEDGIVDSAEELHNANNEVLKKFDTNSETGALEYDGAPISGGHELVTTKSDLDALSETGEKVVEAFLVKQLSQEKDYSTITGTIITGDTSWTSGSESASKIIDNAGYFFELNPFNGINITGASVDLVAKTLTVTFDAAAQDVNIAIFIQEVA